MLIVTITEAGRDVWAGPYGHFERAFDDVLSVNEMTALYNHGWLIIGPRDGNASRIIRVERVTIH